MKKEEVLMLIGVILSGMIAYFSGPQRWWFLGLVSAFAAVSYWLFSRQKESDSRFRNVVLELIGPEKDVYIEVQELHKKGYHLGRYRFSEELQDNSYQGVTTFLADSSYGKVVVKKWEGKGEKGHANQLARFLRGAVLARSISHPRISRVLEIGVSRKKWEAYTVLEYIEGETLDQILLANPQGLGWEEALKLIRQILDGLSQFHKKGIIHRDIKPANVVVNRKGEVTLIDFGLVKEVGDFQLSLSREGIGTLDYAAPEQLQGEKALVGMRSDLFSVGVILYNLLDGIEPYPGVDLRQKKRLEPRLIQKAGVPAYLRDLAYRLVSYDPMDRFGGVEQVVEAIDAENVRIVSEITTEDYERKERLLRIVTKKKEMLEEELHRLKGQVYQLEKQGDEKDRKIRELKILAEEELPLLEREKEILEGDLKKAQDELDSLKDALKDAKKKRDEREKEIEKLREGFSKEREEFKKELEIEREKREGKEEKIRSLEKEVESLRKKHQKELAGLSARIERAEKKAKSDELERLKREVKEVGQRPEEKTEFAIETSQILCILKKKDPDQIKKFILSEEGIYYVGRNRENTNIHLDSPKGGKIASLHVVVTLSGEEIEIGDISLYENVLLNGNSVRNKMLSLSEKNVIAIEGYQLEIERTSDRSKLEGAIFLTPKQRLYSTDG